LFKFVNVNQEHGPVDEFFEQSGTEKKHGGPWALFVRLSPPDIPPRPPLIFSFACPAARSRQTVSPSASARPLSPPASALSFPRPRLLLPFPPVAFHLSHSALRPSLSLQLKRSAAPYVPHTPLLLLHSSPHSPCPPREAKTKSFSLYY
jgi:hypothetical protein